MVAEQPPLLSKRRSRSVRVTIGKASSSSSATPSSPSRPLSPELQKVVIQRDPSPQERSQCRAAHHHHHHHHEEKDALLSNNAADTNQQHHDNRKGITATTHTLPPPSTAGATAAASSSSASASSTENKSMHTLVDIVLAPIMQCVQVNPNSTPPTPPTPTPVPALAPAPAQAVAVAATPTRRTVSFAANLVDDDPQQHDTKTSTTTRIESQQQQHENIILSSLSPVPPPTATTSTTTNTNSSHPHHYLYLQQQQQQQEDADADADDGVAAATRAGGCWIPNKGDDEDEAGRGGGALVGCLSSLEQQEEEEEVISTPWPHKKKIIHPQRSRSSPWPKLEWTGSGPFATPSLSLSTTTSPTPSQHQVTMAVRYPQQQQQVQQPVVQVQHHPTAVDVLCSPLGGDGNVNNDNELILQSHAGNRAFCQLVEANYRDQFLTCDNGNEKLQRAIVAQQLAEIVHAAGGRFLVRSKNKDLDDDDDEIRRNGAAEEFTVASWQDAGLTRGIEMASQLLLSRHRCSNSSSNNNDDESNILAAANSLDGQERRRQETIDAACIEIASAPSDENSEDYFEQENANIIASTETNTHSPIGTKFARGEEENAPEQSPDVVTIPPSLQHVYGAAAGAVPAAPQTAALQLAPPPTIPRSPMVWQTPPRGSTPASCVDDDTRDSVPSSTTTSSSSSSHCSDAHPVLGPSPPSVMMSAMMTGSISNNNCTPTSATPHSYDALGYTSLTIASVASPPAAVHDPTTMPPYDETQQPETPNGQQELYDDKQAFPHDESPQPAVDGGHQSQAPLHGQQQPLAQDGGSVSNLEEDYPFPSNDFATDIAQRPGPDLDNPFAPSPTLGRPPPARGPHWNPFRTATPTTNAPASSWSSRRAAAAASDPEWPERSSNAAWPCVEEQSQDWEPVQLPLAAPPSNAWIIPLSPGGCTVGTTDSSSVGGGSDKPRLASLTRARTSPSTLTWGTRTPSPRHTPTALLSHHAHPLDKSRSIDNNNNNNSNNNNNIGNNNQLLVDPYPNGPTAHDVNAWHRSLSSSLSTMSSASSPAPWNVSPSWQYPQRQDQQQDHHRQREEQQRLYSPPPIRHMDDDKKEVEEANAWKSSLESWPAPQEQEEHLSNDDIQSHNLQEL